MRLTENVGTDKELELILGLEKQSEIAMRKIAPYMQFVPIKKRMIKTQLLRPPLLKAVAFIGLSITRMFRGIQQFH